VYETRIEEVGQGFSMHDQEIRAKHFREAEASFRLEGMDASEDGFYQSVKARVIAGEIDGDEMMRLLLEDAKLRVKRVGTQLAHAS
jgi:hypothetical protein